jgi:hypothetical protein
VEELFGVEMVDGSINDVSVGSARRAPSVVYISIGERVKGLAGLRPSHLRCSRRGSPAGRGRPQRLPGRSAENRCRVGSGATVSHPIKQVGKTAVGRRRKWYPPGHYRQLHSTDSSLYRDVAASLLDLRAAEHRLAMSMLAVNVQPAGSDDASVTHIDSLGTSHRATSPTEILGSSYFDLKNEAPR